MNHLESPVAFTPPIHWRRNVETVYHLNAHAEDTIDAIIANIFFKSHVGQRFQRKSKRRDGFGEQARIIASFPRQHHSSERR